MSPQRLLQQTQDLRTTRKQVAQVNSQHKRHTEVAQVTRNKTGYLVAEQIKLESQQTASSSTVNMPKSHKYRNRRNSSYPAWSVGGHLPELTDNGRNETCLGSMENAQTNGNGEGKDHVGQGTCARPMGQSDRCIRPDLQ